MNIYYTIRRLLSYLSVLYVKRYTMETSIAQITRYHAFSRLVTSSFIAREEKGKKEETTASVTARENERDHLTAH